MEDQLSKQDWNLEMSGLGLAECWDRFAEKIDKLLEKHVPESKSAPARRGRVPFITMSCKKSYKTKKEQNRKKFKYCKTNENFTQYKMARNSAITELRKSKYEYERDLAAKIKNRKQAVLEICAIKN